MADSSLLPITPAAGNANEVLFEAMKKSAAAAAGSDEKLMQAAKEFEAILVTQMLQVMRQSVPKSELLEEDPGRDTYYQMLDIEIGRQAARRGSLGLAETLYRQLGGKIEAVSKGSEAAKAAVISEQPEVRVQGEQD